MSDYKLATTPEDMGATESAEELQTLPQDHPLMEAIFHMRCDVRYLAANAHKIAAFERLEPVLKEWLKAEIAWRDEPGAEPSTEIHIRRGQAHNNLRKALIKEPPHGE